MAVSNVVRRLIAALPLAAAALLMTCGLDQLTNANTALEVALSSDTVLVVGATTQLTPAATNGTPLTGTHVAWTSSAPAVATVDASGVVTGVGEGTTTITATLTAPELPPQGVTASRTMVVGYAGLVITPIDSLTGLGQAVTPTVRGTSASNAPVATVVAALASSDPTIVFAAGSQLTAKKNGTATITATYKGLSAQTTVKVRQVAKRITFGANPFVFRALGRDTSVTVTVVDTRDSAIASPALTWSSLNTAITTVSAAGLMRALQVAATTIRATVDTVTASLLVSVSQLPTSISKLAGDGSVQTVNTPVPTAPKVVVRDAGNATVAGVSVTFTVSAGGGSVAGGTQTTDGSGVATVGSWTLGTAAGPDSLIAAAGSLTARFGALAIAAAPAKLALAAPPAATAQSGVALAQQPVVQLQDGFGNNALQAGVAVTAAIASGGGTLSGTTTISTNASGAAPFADLAISGTVGARTLGFSAPSLTGVSSGAIVTSAGPAAALAVTTQPSTSAQSGVVIAQQPVVQLQDAAGNAVAQAGVVVTATIAAGTGSLGGSTTATTNASGAAIFSGLVVTGLIGSRTLGFSAPSLAGATSNAISVGAGAAAQLVIMTQPSAMAQAGLPFAQQPVIQLEDAAGNAVAQGNVVVNASIATGGGSLGSSTSATTSAGGAATFAGLAVNGTVGSRTLGFAATGLTGATSNAVSITPGPASALAVTVQPSAATSGQPISPAVEVAARDQFGNTANGFTSTITLALGSNPGGGTLAGTAAVAAVAGVATFGSLSIDKAGTGYTLTASATGLTAATSSSFNITAGAASKLAFTAQPSSTTAGTAISPAVQVTVQDAQGNTVTTPTTSISLGVGTNPGSGTLSGTTTVAAVSGVATFTTLSIDKVGTGYTLTASATGLTAATSSTFNITAGAASKLAFTAQPSNATASAAISPAVQVTVQDANGNAVTTATTSISLAIGTNPGSGALSGTTAVSAVSGVATFSTLSISKVGTGYTVTASATGLTAATSSTFNITAGAASKLTFTAQPSSATAGAPISPAVQVTVQDAQGNTVTTASTAITVAFGANPGSATLAGTTTVNAANGVAAFGDLTVSAPGTGYTLTATATGLTSATTAAFAVVGPPTKLAFAVQPSNVTAGSVIAPSIQILVQDAAGNTVASAANSITLAVGTNPGSGTLTGGGATAAVNGVATFSGVSINKSGTGYTLTVAASGLTGATSAAFNVTTGTASRLVFLVQPSNSPPSVAITPAVQIAITDALGNTVTTATTSITVAIGTNPASGTLGGTAQVAAVSGIATFSNLTINNPGSGYTLTSAATGLTGATSTAFNINPPGTPRQLRFVAQPSNTTGGVAISPAITVKVVDSIGTTVTSSTASITLSFGANPNGGTLSGTLTAAAVSGVATFSNVKVDRAGSGYTLAASATALAPDTSTTFTISAGSASVLAFTVQPSTVVVGAAMAPAIQVAIQDGQGNTVTSAAANVTLTLGTNPGGATLTGGTASPTTSGVATFSNVSLDKVANGYTLTASATGFPNATSTAFNVTAGAPAVLVFTTQPVDVSVGATMSAVAVTVRDASGNVVTATTAAVTLALLNNPTGVVLSGTTTVTPVNGVASFSTLSLDRPGQGLTLQATAAGLTSAPSSAFNAVGPARQLRFVTQPSSATAGVAISPGITVKVVDTLGTSVPTSTASITLAFSANPNGGTLSGTLTVAAVNGVATFSNVRVNRAGAGYTLAAGASGLSSDTSTAFSISAGPASVLAFTVQPSTVAVVTAMAPAIQVAIQDAQGNTVTSAAANVTLTLGTNPGGATLTGGTASPTTSGVATFSNVSLDKVANGYALTASATGFPNVTSTAFNVTAGAPAVLAFTVQPPLNPAVGAVLSPAVQVTVRDGNGNTVTTATTQVTVALLNNPVSATLGGTVTRAASNGVATFNDLTLDKPGQGFTVQATATSLTSATSSAFNAIGPATKLAFTTQPSTTILNGTITPSVVVTVQDAAGNTITSASTSITVTIGTNPGSGTLGGTVTRAASNGVATFNDLTINAAGTGYTQTASASGLTGATSTTFDINAFGTAAKLAFVTQPSNADVGAAISPAVQLAVQDASGNTVTNNSSATVTAAFGANPGSATLGGTLTATATNGIATFSNLTVSAAGSGYTLSASSSGLTSATSAAFNVVNPGAAIKLGFVQQPTATTAGSVIVPAVTVAVQNSAGSTVTTDNSTVVSITVASGPGPLRGTLAATAVNGIATFSTISDTVAGSYTLRATASGLTAATSGSFGLTAGVASKLLFLQQPTNTEAGLLFAPIVRVAIADVYGNTAPSATNSVTIIQNNDYYYQNYCSSTVFGSLAGTTSVAAVAGVASFTNLRPRTTAVNALLLRATSPGLADGCSHPVYTVTPSAPTGLRVTVPVNSFSQPFDQIANGVFVVQVFVIDSLGNDVNAGSNVISLAIGSNPGSGSLSGATNILASNGQASFSVSVDKSGNGYNLVASASGLASGTSANFNVLPYGTASRLGFVGQPSDGLVGVAISPAVRVCVQDALGNTVTNAVNSITIAIGTNPSGATLGGTTTVAASSGCASFSNLTLSKVGTGYTLAASASALTGATSSTFDIQ